MGVPPDPRSEPLPDPFGLPDVEPPRERAGGGGLEQHSPAVLSTTVKGAYDMSLKSFILRLLLCTSALL